MRSTLLLQSHQSQLRLWKTRRFGALVLSVLRSLPLTSALITEVVRSQCFVLSVSCSSCPSRKIQTPSSHLQQTASLASVAALLADIFSTSSSPALSDLILVIVLFNVVTAETTTKAGRPPESTPADLYLSQPIGNPANPPAQTRQK